jgi:hypothetical protein
VNERPHHDSINLASDTPHRLDAVVALRLGSEMFAMADETTGRFLYPLATPKSAEAPAIVVDVSDVGDMPDVQSWADDAKKLCEQWYPILCQFLATDEWTPPKEIKLVFKRELRVPGATSRNTIAVSADWVRKHPDDFGMVIHELVHVIQAYPDSPNRPGWLVEGIADYIRLWKYEPEVPRPRIDPQKSNYRDSYRTSAAFLAWVSWKYDKRLVRKLDAALRQGSYSDAIFEDVTTKNLDALWEEFVGRQR